jgi:hypothetical protein
MGEFVSLGTRLLGIVVRLLPLFLRKWLFPIAKVRQQIDIELVSLTPTARWFQPNPCIEMSFKIVNRSHLSAVLDRLYVEIWCGQPLCHAWMLKRYEIAAGGVKKDIIHRQYLTASQLAAVKDCQDAAVRDQPLSGGHIDITFYLIAYFESNIGMIDVTDRIERREKVGG